MGSKRRPFRARGVYRRRPIVCGSWTTPQRCRVAERASLARVRRGSVMVAALILLLGLAGLGVVDRAAIAQQVVAQHRWRMAMDPTGLRARRETERAAGRGWGLRECAGGGPVMIVIPAGKFIMGSPESEADRDASEGPQHEVTIAKPFAVSKFEVTFEAWDACV